MVIGVQYMQTGRCMLFLMAHKYRLQPSEMQVPTLEMHCAHARAVWNVALEILQSLGLRAFNPSVTACPGCGRTTSTTFQVLAKQIDDHLRAMMPVWRARYPGVETLRIAVMGCIVNGPGESKHADIGISLPGTGEAPAAPVFIDGQKAMTLRGAGIANEFHRIVEGYIERRFGSVTTAH